MPKNTTLSQVAGFTAASPALSKLVVQGMADKKGQSIAVVDLRTLKNSIADFFVICSGTSDTQVDAISDSVEEVIEKLTGEQPWRREGKMNKEWVLLDYGDVVAHVFQKSKRSFYGLEELWGDADISWFDDSGNPTTDVPQIKYYEHAARHSEDQDYHDRSQEE
jgi:ribosome-associated protein